MKTALGSEVFALRGPEGSPEWSVRLFNGALVAAQWPDRGSALAGASTEEKRILRKAYDLGRANAHSRGPELFNLSSSLERAEFNRGQMDQISEDDHRHFDREPRVRYRD